MTVKLSRPINWAAWTASGAIVHPPRGKPINWPGLALLGLTIAALLVWAMVLLSDAP